MISNNENLYKLRYQYIFALPETPSRGSNYRNDPGVWLWYSDSTRRAEHAHIGGTSQRVANSGVRALWSWKIWKKKLCFLITGGARTPFQGLNESTNHELLFGIQNFPICGTPFPYDSSMAICQVLAVFSFFIISLFSNFPHFSRCSHHTEMGLCNKIWGNLNVHPTIQFL